MNLGSAKPMWAVVVLFPTSAAGPSFDTARIADTNAQGELTLDPLAPGVYKAFAFADPELGWLRVTDFLNLFPSTTVRIVNGEEANVESRLIPRAEFDDARSRF